MPPNSIEATLEEAISAMEAAGMPPDVVRNLREEKEGLTKQFAAFEEFARMTGASQKLQKEKIVEIMRSVAQASSGQAGLHAEFENVMGSAPASGSVDLQGAFISQVNSLVERMGKDVGEFFNTVGVDVNSSDYVDRIRSELEKTLNEGSEDILDRHREVVGDAIKDINDLTLEAIDEFGKRINKAVRRNDIGDMNTRELEAELRKTGGASQDVIDKLKEAAGSAASDGDATFDPNSVLREALNNRRSDTEEFFRNNASRQMFADIQDEEGNTQRMTERQIRERIQSRVLDPDQADHNLESLIEEARESGVGSREIRTAMDKATETGDERSAIHDIAAAAARQQFRRGGGGGGVRGRASQGFKAAGGWGMAAPAALGAVMDLATPGGQSMAESGAQAAGTFTGLAGAGIGAAIGSPAGPLGNIAGGAIGYQVGQSVGRIAKPYTDYINRQKAVQTTFGADEGGIDWLPGMGSAEAGGEGDKAWNLMKAQTGARFSNPAVTGTEIDELTAALAKLGNSAKKTGDLLETSAGLITKYGYTAQDAAYYTDLANKYAPGGKFAAEGFGENRKAAEDEGIEGGQYDEIMKRIQEVAGESMGPMGAAQYGAGTVEAMGNIEDPVMKEQMIKQGVPEKIAALASQVVGQPMQYAAFTDNPAAANYEGMSDEYGNLTGGGAVWANSGVRNLLRTAVRGGNLDPDVATPLDQVSVNEKQGILAAASTIPGLQGWTADEIVLQHNQLVEDPNMLDQGQADAAETASEGTQQAMVDAGVTGEAQEAGKAAGGFGKLGAALKREGQVMGSRLGLNEMPEDYSFTGGVSDMASGIYNAFQSTPDIPIVGDLGGWLMKQAGMGPDTEKRGLAGSDAAEALYEQAEGGYLGYMSTMGEFDPSTLRLAGSEDTLQTVTEEAEGGDRTRLDALEAGDQKFQVGDREATATDIAYLRGQEYASINEDTGEVELTEEGEHYLDTKGGTKDVNVHVTATEWLERAFDFHNRTKDESGGAAVAKGESKERQDSGGTLYGGPLP